MEDSGDRSRSRSESALPSCEDIASDVAADVGQAEVAAAVAVRQPLVIEAHEVQDRGVQVVDVHAVLDRLHPQFVRRAVNHAAFNAPAGQPHRETQAMVVAALGSFGVRCPAEFTAPDDQGVVEQAAGFQIRQESGDRLIALLGVFPVPRDVFVVVPGLIVPVIDLNDTDPALHQSRAIKQA